MPSVAIAGILFFASIAVLVWSVGSKSQERLTTRQFADGFSTDLREIILAKGTNERAVQPGVLILAKLARRLTPAGRVASLDHRRAMAGLPPTWTIEKILASKIVFSVLFTALAKMIKFKGTPGMIGACVFGFFAIDIYINNTAKKRQLQIALELADMLDQITIGVEAGLGFDAAMARASKASSGPLAEEFHRTMSHIHAGLSRAEALRGLGARNKIPELRQFVGAILQADQYGIPMAQVLRVQSTEQRRKRRQRAEEKAMKLPVKILFPLVVCILPSLFIVLVGPAALNISQGGVH